MCRSTKDARNLLLWALGVAAAGASLVLWLTADRGHSADFTSVTAEQRTPYLAEMKENLNGHPTRPRYDKVSEQILVREGIVACQWLATQPTGHSALFDDELRHRYFRAHPRPAAGWPFRSGRTPLRDELLTNSWGWLCPDVASAHTTHPEPGESD
jgi:hypothetical protein